MALDTSTIYSRSRLLSAGPQSGFHNLVWDVGSYVHVAVRRKSTLSQTRLRRRDEGTTHLGRIMNMKKKTAIEQDQLS